MARGSEPAVPYDRWIATCTCRRCGTTAECVEGSVPLTWSTVARDGATDALCADCTRDNVRSIEGKLDEEWW